MALRAFAGQVLQLLLLTTQETVPHTAVTVDTALDFAPYRHC